MQLLSFFLLPLENDKIEGRITIKVDSHRIKNVLHPGQDRQVQFENKNNGVYNRSTLQHY